MTTVDKKSAGNQKPKIKIKPFPIGKELKTKDLHHTAADRTSEPVTKPRPRTPEADENQKDGCRIAEATQSLRQAIFRPDSWP